MDDECPVCMEPLSKLCVQCPNGHWCCEKHFLQLAKAKYESNVLAYNKTAESEKCFVCRQRVPQKNFSDTYNRNRCIVIAFGVAKLQNHSQEKTAKNLHMLQTRYEQWKQRSSASQS